MGHLGIERVVELYKNRFYWPKYESDIKIYVTKICKCLKVKKPTNLR